MAADLGSVSRQALLALGEPHLLPLLPVCERATRRKNPRGFVQECLDTILDQLQAKGFPAEERGTLLLRMQILAGAVTEPEWAKNLFAGVIKMFSLEDNWVYKDILEKGFEKGIEKGEISAARSNLFRILKLRFGSIPPEVAKALEKETDKEKLGRLLDRAVLAASLDEFTSALFAV